MDRTFFIIATLFGALSVASAPFGAHALRDRVEPSLLANYQTGVTYMFYHMLGALRGLPGRSPAGRAAALPVWAGWLFVVGIRLLYRQPGADGLHRPALARRDHAHRRGGVYRGVAAAGRDRVEKRLIVNGQLLIVNE
jgi:hypothetical protein